MRPGQGVLTATAHDRPPAAEGDRRVEAVRSDSHIAVLDGWRGVSILLVLATHLLPLGPKDWRINYATGVMGMVIFFILSGFLITVFLLREPSIGRFLTRRFFRILPLAWAYMVIALLIVGADRGAWLSHFLFYANLPPQQLTPLTAHLWSVCLEMQFYVGIALLVAVAGTRGLLLVPLLCVVFTGIRVANEVYASSITYYRFDEILAGCLLALSYEGRLGQGIQRVIRASPQILVIPLFILSCVLQGEWTNYFRPYLAALLIGTTLVRSEGRLARWLDHRALAYVAGVSYALYVIHPLLAHSWLGSGGLVEKYAKRPLLFAALFLLAHLSTYAFERRCIALGRDVSNRIRSWEQKNATRRESA
jgi:peptidoglycan/LPS O-acetylase OafA/YrhL